jgi:Protein of unknown function (DUF3574)
VRRASIVLILLVTACASTDYRISQAVLSDRLFLGLSIPGGGEVTEEEWRAFLRDEVTPRFPQGLTIFRVEGQWREDDGDIAREPTVILEVVHRHETRVDRYLIEIAQAWKKRFRQEAVLRVTMPARLELID